MNAEGTAPEGFYSSMSLSDNMAPVSKKTLQTEHPARARHEGIAFSLIQAHVRKGTKTWDITKHQC